MTGLLKAQPSPLPPVLTNTEKVADFNRPQWVARPLNDGERSLVLAAKGEIEARLAPARREVIIGLLSRLAVQWPPKDAKAFGLLLADFATDLAEFSELHIAQACREWRQTENWFPKIADLRGRLLVMRSMEKAYFRRSKVLLGEAKARDYERPLPADTAGAEVFNIAEAYEALARGKRATA